MGSDDVTGTPGHGGEPAPQLGRLVGAYRLVELIGRGGMGVVYLAERADGQFRKRVALKLMATGPTDPGLEKRFRLERQILADLDHPGFARLMDGGVTSDGQPYLVMELVEGRPLGTEIPPGGVSLKRFFDLAIPLAETLAVAHRAGVIHRDLKPANVMVRPDGSPKVLDFGIAKRAVPPLAAADDIPTESVSQLTNDQRLIGTIPYMSPEQVRAQDVDARTDLFSLGVLLFELLAGRRPFAADTTVDLIFAILKEPVPDLVLLRPDVPAALVSLVGRCLEKDRERRIASADELRRQLTELRNTTTDAAGRDAATSAVRPEAQCAIAVLPFATFSDSEQVGFLASGLHNDLITDLSRLPGVTVISRASAMSYRDTTKSPKEIGRELSVETLVTGAVQSAGHRVRLTAELVDCGTTTTRWAERFDRELSAETLFAIQSELSTRIVESLHSTLQRDEVLPAGRRQTSDLEAYRLVSVGRLQFDRKTEAGFCRAVECFEQAVERDPDYVLAWAGLADALALMEDYGYGESAALLARAKRAADRALSLDPDSAEAHTSLGLYYSTLQDGPAALREYELAIAIQPGYANAHNWLSWTNLLLGRPAVALDYARRAVALDPRSAEPVSNLAWSLIATGDAEGALAEARNAGELSEGWTTARLAMGVALHHAGRPEEAIAPLTDLTVEWAGLGAEAALAAAHAACGDRELARAVLARLPREADPFATGFVHLALGDTAQAFEWFERVQTVPPWPTMALHLFYGHLWETVRHDARYGDLIRRAYRSWGVSDIEGRAS